VAGRRARPEILEDRKPLTVAETAQEACAAGTIGKTVILRDGARQTDRWLPAIDQRLEQSWTCALGAPCTTAIFLKGPLIASS
jgi:hypothetical protein